MAKAEIVTIPPVEPERRVHLDLSVEEAMVIAVLTGSIYGCASDHVTAEIYHALTDTGLPVYCTDPAYKAVKAQFADLNIRVR